jgi:acyl-CoA thioesterase-2
MLLFAAVVREGSFTRAAAALGITKQSASSRVQALEERLGVRLLERTTRRLRPTDAGALYFERCSAIATAIDDANREVRQRQAEPTGLLRVSAPVLYEVDRLRDGGSYSARRVLAIQGGEPLFSLMASFMTPEEGFDHQTAPPDVPPPEALKNERQLAIELAERYPAARPMIKVASGPIEMRPVQPLNYLEPQPMPARRQIWYRTVGPLPDDPLTHRALLAYASDFNFLVTAMLPHGVTWVTPGMQVTSLDHAMWFHRPFRFDEWLLYDLESPSAHGGRGVVRGRFYTRDGVLAASVVQEGLMRDRSRARRT